MAGSSRRPEELATQRISRSLRRTDAPGIELRELLREMFVADRADEAIRFAVRPRTFAEVECGRYAVLAVVHRVKYLEVGNAGRRRRAAVRA